MGMKPTFSGTFTAYGNSTYILFPKNILAMAGIDPNTALFSAEVDQPDDDGPVEIMVRVWAKPESKKAKDAAEAKS